MRNKSKNLTLNSMLIWLWIFWILIISLLGLYFFNFRSWLESFSLLYSPEPTFISPADTYTYWFYATTLAIKDIPLNLLGPSLIIKILHSFDFIFLINLITFTLILIRYFYETEIDIIKLAVLILINPLILFQFLGPDKEIYIIFSLLLMGLYFFSKKNSYFFGAIFFAIFSKPEFMIILFIASFIYRLKPSIKISSIIIILLLISIFYNELPGMVMRNDALMFGQDGRSNGVSVFLQDLASKYFLFPLIIIPRLLMNIYEGVISLIILKKIDEFEMCNFISSVFFNIILIINLGYHKFKDHHNGLFILVFMFVIMVATVPFPHHRYLLPIYTILAVIAAEKISLRE